ncbi:MAG: response regulator [Desulfobacterales bacterium]|nr:response regulator [Desulfobacterales bacterium]
MELLPADIHFPSFLEGVARIVRARAEEKALDFIVETRELPGGARADEVRLRQALLNLLNNAVKFTEKGGVTLRVGAMGRPEGATRTIRFEVADTGVGIAPDELDEVFQPFKQAGDIRGRAGGTGLGLSISRQLVSAMAGELRADSAPGRGSVFRFEISLPVVAAEAKEPQPDREITGYAGPRRKVLVVDDHRENRVMLHEMLELVGFEVFLAANGREAANKALDIRPDLILMDLVMPEMTGFEAARAIRREPALAHTPIIAVSASVLESDQAKSRIAGCDAFLSKPVKTRELYDLLETRLNLTWTYAKPAPETMAGRAPKGPLLPPPPEELAILREMALIGDMSDIEDRATRIASLGEQYRPFCETLRGLARNFAEKEILALLERFPREDET